ncbi:Organic cation/carnitine transporter 7 [Orobanche gracilis]
MTTMFFLCFIILLPLMFHQPQSLTTGLLFGARICITGTFTVIYIYAPEEQNIGRIIGDDGLVGNLLSLAVDVVVSGW